MGYNPLPGCAEEELGRMWSHPKQVDVDQNVAYHRHKGVGPATNSLDHRARVCYLPCCLSYDELCRAVGVHSLSIPPFTF